MKRALLVIDVQNEYFTGKLPVSYPANSLEKILKAMDFARSEGIPVVVVQHTSPQENAATFRKGSNEWELHNEVAVRPRDFQFEKTLPGSFTGTGLENWIKENKVETLVIAGYMTQMCCDTTSRQAAHLGYKVEFLSDATGTLAFTNAGGSVTAEELHRAILVTQAIRFSKVMSTEEWIKSVSTEKIPIPG